MKKESLCSGVDCNVDEMKAGIPKRHFVISSGMGIDDSFMTTKGACCIRLFQETIGVGGEHQVLNGLVQ